MPAAPLRLPMWYRVLAVAVGVVSILLAVIVLVHPAVALFLLIFLLAFALLAIGIDRLVSGVTGHLYGWTLPMPPDAQGGTGVGATPPSPSDLPSKP